MNVWGRDLVIGLTGHLAEARRSVTGKPSPQVHQEAHARRTPGAEARQRRRFVGRVRSITLRPHSDDVPALVVDLETDDGGILLVWLGRRRIAGIRPGVPLSAHGLVTSLRGGRVIYNPAYELLPAQEAS